MTARESLLQEPVREDKAGDCDMRWWERPSIPVASGVVAAFVYALFPSSDTNALIALCAWGAVVLVWMAASARV